MITNRSSQKSAILSKSSWWTPSWRLWSRATILSLDVNNLPISVASLAEFTWHQLIEIVAKHAV
ncbi:Hypothetical predicted protein [Mytilus galloprovincialis]|uniref:Uncharacterized protein n=1 Tax=Mytilus galloprovincialis TaxID=29158 RepID=A0A8B6EFV8_MYTGA|nr:Hypothetical predicted protein [Mytilus galloprovincialis]